MKTNKEIIYFDNNATTPVDARVLKAMLPYFSDYYANANSRHKFGSLASEATETARIQVSELIGAEPKEVVFTSGATEAINMALKGVAMNHSLKGKHIITATTEHPAVLDTCRYLETLGFEITFLPVLPDGLVELTDLTEVLRSDTILVTIMMVNNETGVIQPVKEIAYLTHQIGALFMCDATQAVGKIPINVDSLGIDLMCISGHKFYAPKGVGALYVRQISNHERLPALLHGGGHEHGLRSGTLNVPGIVGLGVASEIAKAEMEQDSQRILILRNHLENSLLKNPGFHINGHINNRIFNVSNICFVGYDSNVVIGRMKNVALSNGSACNSYTIRPSHVLTAMGLNIDDSFASMRFSLGRSNTLDEITEVLELTKEILSSRSG